MIRVSTLVAAAAVVLSAGATPVNAAAPHTNVRAEGAVTSLSVVPATGQAEVVIAISGAMEVQDFTLAGPHRIVVDFAGATLGMPPRLYDEIARGGITNVRIGQYKEDVVRVVVDLDAPREYTVTREANAVRVTIAGMTERFPAWHSTAELATPMYDVADRAEPVTPEQVIPLENSPPRFSQQAQQPRITVTYQDADIRDVLAAFAAFSGRTIVVGREVTGTVTAEIRDQPWDVALRAILDAQGLAATEDQYGIITVDSYGNMLAKQATEPLVTRMISVNYARAASLVQTMESLLSRDCQPGAATTQTATSCVTRGSVVADSGTNTLLITDVPSRIDDLVGYVSDLDVRTPQVAIKAKIIFVNRTDIEDLGVTYDLGTQRQFFNRLVQRPDPSTFEPIDTNGDGVPDALGGGTPFPSTTNIIDIGGNALAGIANANQRVINPALQLIFSTAIGKFDLTAFIDALQEVRLADIQAEPSIVTLDNRKAEILSGEETPIRIVDLSSAAATGGAARATVDFKETGIILSVTPHITNNRQVLMTLHAERSNLQPAASDLGFTFQKQRADNQLLVADGETAVIGGLTVTEVAVSKEGIPILVDLPFIGRLFGRTRTEETKRDLLILVTPHILDDGAVIGPASDTR
ncbi:MAG: AMIN domain-containing protein [Gemmatimonadaceae bacterium]